MKQAIPAMGDVRSPLRSKRSAPGSSRCPAGADFAPVLAQLPGVAFDVPHYGFVRSGSVVTTYRDGRSETAKTGDLYWMEPGHTGVSCQEETVLIDFSPRREDDELMAAISRIVTGG